MFEPGDESTELPHYDRQSVLVMTILAEVFVLLIASIWIYFAQIDLRPLITFNMKVCFFGIAGGLLVTILNLAIWKLADKYSAQNYLLASMKDLIDKQMLPLMGHLNFIDSIFIALVSGLSEEVFFRGVLQSQCGIVPSACAFGLAHLPRIYYFPYALWATYVGLLMSFLVSATDSICAPMIAHAVINFASINVLRIIHKRRSAEGQKPGTGATGS